jgi:hypothetical protein
MRKLITLPFKVCITLYFIFTLCNNNTILAQATDASIIGTVTDETGQALPGATVLIRNESTGFKSGTITNTSGDFSFKQLPLGNPYTITLVLLAMENRREPVMHSIRVT